ncbi:hypothetical protein, partial [Paraburkholderia caffeinilytica]|uniref:hypothetical protein n=1 Tax=Paraburkholderia caffeinilytica TaxID=1761016 RepID=UPI0038B6CC0D
MNTRKFNQYYFGVIRSTAIAAGVVLLITQVAYSASADTAPKWTTGADAPMPASGAHVAMQVAQNDSSAAGAAGADSASDEPTAAEDAALVFSPRDCIPTSVGGCQQHRGGNGAASAGSGGEGASGNGAGGAAGSAGGGGKGNGGGSGGGGSSSGGGSSGGGSSGGGSSGGGSSGGGSSGGGSSGGGSSGGGSSGG